MQHIHLNIPQLKIFVSVVKFQFKEKKLPFSQTLKCDFNLTQCKAIL